MANKYKHIQEVPAHLDHSTRGFLQTVRTYLRELSADVQTLTAKTSTPGATGLIIQPSNNGGGAATGLKFSSEETPTPAPNGVTTAFAMLFVPDGNFMIVTNNGQALYNGVGYTVAGAVVTFLAGFIPQTGDLVRIWYSHA